MSTLKEFLACELAKTCFENCGLTSELETVKEQLSTAQRVKEYLVTKSTNLELKIHDISCENASINEQRTITDIKAKNLEDTLLENQSYIKMLESKIKVMYRENRSMEKNDIQLNYANREILLSAQKVYDIFDNLDLES